jgi:hypothetical protein
MRPDPYQQLDTLGLLAQQLTAKTEGQDVQQALAAQELTTLRASYATLQGLYQQSQTALVQTQAQLATKLNRTGDTATGPLMVPAAKDAAAATQLQQTYGGLNAPIRFVTAVGATAVAMQPGPLTDPTPQGRKAKPYNVILTMRTAPAAGLGATITVGTTAGGSEVFSKTFLLTALPGLSTVLAPMQPVFIELPPGTTLYAKATAGTWDVEVFSYYKS